MSIAGLDVGIYWHSVRSRGAFGVAHHKVTEGEPVERPGLEVCGAIAPCRRAHHHNILELWTIPIRRY